MNALNQKPVDQHTAQSHLALLAVVAVKKCRRDDGPSSFDCERRRFTRALQQMTTNNTAATAT
ncbi:MULTISPECIES: hypothetical protein [Bradyrhizobium]|uniref:hypothetical protein n=1 Tax=Bradyrhizobium TaxID=374 RepID=UPI00155E48A6|nr:MULTISPECIES: hypothetical protein [Bradyrhizobium]MDD1562959.1 hypothetical protein [Bradyrhizobium sp. WBAH33]QCJ98842.1 hypothetical protein DAA61_25270 [Bradyrhizobium sp. WBAH33]QCK06208.1 hypothetical protein DAB18_25305 [Bradyrhizobium sp. WBAH41]UUO30257.1 hypothetical protein DCG74_24935 [Bradyrhizobium sp. WBAH42]